MQVGRDKDWLTRKEATAFLTDLGYAVAPQTLANLAAKKNRGGGPPFRRFRKKTVRYLRAALIAWAEKQAEDVA